MFCDAVLKAFPHLQALVGRGLAIGGGASFGTPTQSNIYDLAFELRGKTWPSLHGLQG
jgi:hypothetical protein